MSDLSLVNTPEWAAVIKRIIRSEMALHDVSYAELSRRLQSEFAIHQSESNLKAKINKGVLGAQLFVQILNVLGTTTLELKQVKALYVELTQKPGK